MNDHPHQPWKHHSLKFLEMAFRTDRQEHLKHPDGYGRKARDCGDTVEIFLTLDGGRIQFVSYSLLGCMNTNACVNAVIELIQGKTLADAWALRPVDVSDFLETLPEDHFHCAELATGALRAALANARDLRQSPWKKKYGAAQS